MHHSSAICIWHRHANMNGFKKYLLLNIVNNNISMIWLLGTVQYYRQPVETYHIFSLTHTNCIYTQWIIFIHPSSDYQCRLPALILSKIVTYTHTHSKSWRSLIHLSLLPESLPALNDSLPHTQTHANSSEENQICSKRKLLPWATAQTCQSPDTA